MGSNHSRQHMVKTMSDLWQYSDAHGLKCPKCQSDILLVQADVIQDDKTPYQTYDTIVECMSCSYSVHATSYTVLGCVNQYDLNHITITGWAPSGARIEKTIEHLLDYQLLKELKRSEELVEFLIVDDHAIQVI